MEQIKKAFFNILNGTVSFIEILKILEVYLYVFTSWFFIIIPISLFVTNDLHFFSKNLVRKGFINQILGFDYRKYLELSEKKDKSEEEKLYIENENNTNIIVYRNTPIAAITLKIKDDHFEKGFFSVIITGLHVKKVFHRAQLNDLLIKWAIKRSRELCREVKKKQETTIDQIKIFFYEYTIPSINKDVLKANNFKFDANVSVQETESELIFDKHLYRLLIRRKLYNLFNIKRQAFFLTMSV